MSEPPVADSVPAGGWVSGGDGVCATVIDHEAVESYAAPGTAHSTVCGRPASQPVLVHGHPHLVCTVCAPILVECGNADPFPEPAATELAGIPPDSIDLLP